MSRQCFLTPVTIVQYPLILNYKIVLYRVIRRESSPLFFHLMMNLFNADIFFSI